MSCISKKLNWQLIRDGRNTNRLACQTIREPRLTIISRHRATGKWVSITSVHHFDMTFVSFSFSFFVLYLLSCPRSFSSSWNLLQTGGISRWWRDLEPFGWRYTQSESFLSLILRSSGDCASYTGKLYAYPSIIYCRD